MDSSKPDETIKKIREFLDVSSMVCGSCGNLGPVTVANEHVMLITEPKKYGIKNLHDWHEKMEECEDWIFKNEKLVRKSLKKKNGFDKAEIEFIKTLYGDFDEHEHMHDHEHNHEHEYDDEEDIDVEMIGSDEFERVWGSKHSLITNIVMQCEDRKCKRKGKTHTHHFVL